MEKKLKEHFLSFLENNIHSYKCYDDFKEIMPNQAPFYKYFLKKGGLLYCISYNIPSLHIRSFLLFTDDMHAGISGNTEIIDILTDYGNINLKEGIMETNLPYKIFCIKN